MLREAEPFDELHDALADPRRLDAREEGVACERFLEAPARRNRHQLGQVPDAVTLDELSRPKPANRNRPGGWLQIPEQQCDERTLTSAVRPGEPKDLPAPDSQTDIDDRGDTAAQPAIGLADVLEMDE
jgi:hypothetical protein